MLEIGKTQVEGVKKNTRCGKINQVPLLCRSLDPEHTGKIDENHFRKMMKSKEAIPEQDIEDMLQGTTV